MESLQERIQGIIGKFRTLESARKSGTTVVFVPTVIKSINDHELGPIIRYAQKHLDVVHAVNFQPFH